MGRKVIHILAALTALVVFSCNKFEYGEGGLNECSLISAKTGGKGYTVIAARQVNSLHYVWQPDSAAQAVRVGDYYAVAFLAEGSLYRMDGLSEFAADSSVSMQEIYASLPELSQEDTIVDCNPYAPFIVHADSVLMCASQRFSAMDSTMTVTFEPVSLTQSLKFRFRLQTDRGVEVSSVDAILSGVAGRVRLMTGQVRNDVDNPTYKLYLNLKRLSEGDVVLYEGSANVLGLFPSDSEIYKVGPGILHLKVEASVDEDGELKQKVFYAGINLKNLIEAAELMTAAEDQSGYRLNKREAVLEIPVPLQVKRDKVISASGEGFSQWFINDGEIDVDV